MDASQDRITSVRHRGAPDRSGDYHVASFATAPQTAPHGETQAIPYRSWLLDQRAGDHRPLCRYPLSMLMRGVWQSSPLGHGLVRSADDARAPVRG